MKIKRDMITGGGIIEHLLIEAVSASFKSDKKLEQFMSDIDYDNKDELEVCLMFEGKEVGLKAVCKLWEDSIDTMVKEKAVELIREKMGDLDDAIHSLGRHAVCTFKKKLGIKITDDDLYFD